MTPEERERRRKQREQEQKKLDELTEVINDFCWKAPEPSNDAEPRN